MVNITGLWEKRAQNYKSKIEGVLPKSFPPHVNKYLDIWMWQNIKNQISKQKKEVKVLDIGCGYGRLSTKVARDFPGSRIYGVDVSRTYVEIFNKTISPTGKAFVADMKSLPFKDNFFDCVYIATTLMYLTKLKDQQKAIKEVYRVSKSSGKFVIIERNPIGHKIITLGGLIGLIRGKKHQEIKSVSFTTEYMATLIDKSGFVIQEKSGIPAFTLLLPFILISSKISKNVSLTILEISRVLDEKLSWLLTPSLYISYSCTKK